MHNPVSPLILMSLLATASGAISAGEHREHGAHVHGTAHLDIALEGDALAVELTTPAANLLGFEHAPENDDQRARLREVTGLLQDGPALFTLPPDARCAQESAAVESELLEDGHHHEAGEAHHHGEAGEEDHVHADFHVSYRFHCEAVSALTHMDVNLFTHFPATEKLEVQLITPARQTGVELTPGNARLGF